jgi:hypothetical protein
LPNKYLAIVCSFLLGFGDACFNTQIFSILGSVYKDNSSAAFAIYKFVQSAAAAIAFFYSQHFPLYYQLAILVGFNVVGTLAFLRVELTKGSRIEGANNSGILAEDNLDIQNEDSRSNHSDDQLLNR